MQVDHTVEVEFEHGEAPGPVLSQPGWLGVGTHESGEVIFGEVVDAGRGRPRFTYRSYYLDEYLDLEQLAQDGLLLDAGGSSTRVVVPADQIRKAISQLPYPRVTSGTSRTALDGTVMSDHLGVDRVHAAHRDPDVGWGREVPLDGDRLSQARERFAGQLQDLSDHIGEFNPHNPELQPKISKAQETIARGQGLLDSPADFAKADADYFERVSDRTELYLESLGVPRAETSVGRPRAAGGGVALEDQPIVDDCEVQP